MEFDCLFQASQPLFACPLPSPHPLPSPATYRKPGSTSASCCTCRTLLASTSRSWLRGSPPLAFCPSWRRRAACQSCHPLSRLLTHAGLRVLLSWLTTHFTPKNVIITGLIVQAVQVCWVTICLLARTACQRIANEDLLQLALYGLFHVKWMMYAIGALVAVSSITYPAISAFLSKNSSPEQQVWAASRLPSPFALLTTHWPPGCGARHGDGHSQSLHGTGACPFWRAVSNYGDAAEQGHAQDLSTCADAVPGRPLPRGGRLCHGCACSSCQCSRYAQHGSYSARLTRGWC